MDEMKIIGLRQERAELWEKAKAFLDEKQRTGGLNADDEATYEKMEKELTARAKGIERLEKLRDIKDDLNKPLDTIVVKERPDNGETKAALPRATDGYKNAFWTVMRDGDDPRKFKNELNIGTDSQGGYLVPDEYERKLVEGLEDVNIMRQLATTIRTSNGDRIIPLVASRGTANWMTEGATFTESDVAFDQITLSAYKLGTAIKITDELLTDSVFNMDSFIADEFSRRVGSAEEEAFISGDGAGKPSGVLTGGTAAITTGSATAITADEIIDLIYKLRAPYRPRASFLLNDTTIKNVRKLKDATGQYLWQPSLVVGNPDRLFGYPIYTSPFMPEIATGQKTIAFGDFKYYWIADRQGRVFRRLNELYATSGMVGFLIYERLDAKVILPEAIQILKQA
jgi:HK97 family phage major capsid protein